MEDQPSRVSRYIERLASKPQYLVLAGVGLLLLASLGVYLNTLRGEVDRTFDNFIISMDRRIQQGDLAEARQELEAALAQADEAEKRQINGLLTRVCVKQKDFDCAQKYGGSQLQSDDEDRHKILSELVIGAAQKKDAEAFDRYAQELMTYIKDNPRLFDQAAILEHEEMIATLDWRKKR